MQQEVNYYKINDQNFYKVTNDFALHLDVKNRCISNIPLDPFKAVKKMYDLIEIDEEEFSHALKELVLELGIWQYVKSKD